MAATSEQFEALVRQHAAVIAAAVRRVCLRKHRALMPDVTQEVHIKLWKVLESGKKIDNPPSYIYRIALTTGLTMVEQANKHHSMAGRLADEPLTSRSVDAASTETARLIEELIATLEPDFAKALQAYLAGYNHVDIAGLFGWTESVARHRVYRSFDKLKRFMKEQDVRSGEHGR